MKTYTSRHRAGVVPVAVLALCLLSGCTTDTSRSGSDQPGALNPPDTAVGSPAVAHHASVSTSSYKDMAAEFRANGVDDEPEKWAKAVVEGRPFAPGQQGANQLQQALTRAGADPDTIARVTATLVP